MAEKILLEVEFDSAQAEQRATQLRKTVGDLAVQRRELNKAIKENQKEEARLTQAIATQQSALKGLIASGKQNTQEYENASKELRSLQSELGKVRDTQQDYFQQLNQTENAQKVARRELNLLNKEAQAATGSLNQQRAQLAQLNRVYDQFRVGIDGTEKDLRDLERQIDGLTKEISEQEQATGRFQRNVGNYAGGIRQGFASAVPAAALLTGGIAGISAAVTGAINQGKEVINVYKNFERQLLQLKAISGATEEQFRLLESEAKRLGGSTEFTASQVAELQTNFAKLGFNPDEIVAATSATLDLATATGEDLARSAEVAGATVRAFNLDTTETGRVVDVMAASFSGSALDLEKFSTSMRQVGPVAAALGFSVEDTTALLGTLANAGFDASQAGTSLRNIFLNLADPAGSLAQALGRNITSVEELAPALNELQASGIDVAGALELTDKRSVAAFQRFLTGADDALKLSQSLNQANGAAAGMAGTIRDSLQGDLDTMGSAFESLQITIGEAVAPAIRSIIRGLTSLIIALRELPAFIKENKVELIALGSALLAFNAQAIAAAANQIRMAAVQKAATIATRAQAVAQRALNLVLNANPIGLIITAVGLLVAAFAALYNRSQTLRAGLAGAFAFIRQVASNYIGAVVDQFIGLKEIILGIWDFDRSRIQAGAAKFADATKRQFTGLGEGAADAFNQGYQNKIDEEAAAAEVKKLSEPAITQAGTDGETAGEAFNEGFEKARKRASNRANEPTKIDTSTTDAPTLSNEELKAKEAEIKSRLVLAKKGSEDELKIQSELAAIKRDMALNAEGLLAEEKLLIQAEYTAEVAEIERKRQDLTLAELMEGLYKQEAAIKLSRARGELTEEQYKINVLRIQEARLQAELTQLEKGSAEYLNKQAEIAEKQAEITTALSGPSQAELFDIEQAKLDLSYQQSLITEQQYTESLLAIRIKRAQSELSQLEKDSAAYIAKQAEIQKLKNELEDPDAIGDELEELQKVTEAVGSFANDYVANQDRMIEAEAIRAVRAREGADATEEQIQREIEARKAQSTSYQLAKAAQKTAAISEILIARAQQISQVQVAAAKIAATFPPPAGPILAGVYVAANVAAAIADTRRRLAEVNALEQGGMTTGGERMQITHQGRIVKKKRSYKDGGVVRVPTMALTGEAGAEYVGPNHQIRRYPALFRWLDRDRNNPGIPMPAAAMPRLAYAMGGFTNIEIPAYADGGLTARAAEQVVNQQLSVQASIAFADAVANLPAPIVTVEDINAGQERTAQVENSANI